MFLFQRTGGRPTSSRNRAAEEGWTRHSGCLADRAQNDAGGSRSPPPPRRGEGGFPKHRGYMFHRLVVKTVYRQHPFTGDSCQPAAGDNVNGMGRMATAGFLEMLKAVRAQMLDHRSTGSHVEELHSPADPHKRQFPLQGFPDQIKFQIISFRVHLPNRQGFPVETKGKCPPPENIIPASRTTGKVGIFSGGLAGAPRRFQRSGHRNRAADPFPVVIKIDCDADHRLVITLPPYPGGIRRPAPRPGMAALTGTMSHLSPPQTRKSLIKMRLLFNRIPW